MGNILLHVTYLCTISMSLYTACWLMARGNRNGTTAALAVCQILVMIWCIPQMFAGAVATVEMKYLVYGISYVGISFIGPAWLEFSFRYCKKALKSWIRLALFGISALNFSVFLCNDSCLLFYRKFSIEQVEYGPVFYFHMLYTYVCVFLGIAAVLREFVRKQVAVVHLALILLSAAIPMGFNLLYISGVVKSSFDLTPPAFALSSLLMLFAVFRYDFLDVNTMTSGQIFASIAEGVVVYNRHGRLTYCNQAAMQWLKLGKENDFEDVRDRLRQLGAKVCLEYGRTGGALGAGNDTEEHEDGPGAGNGTEGQKDIKEFRKVVLDDGMELRIRQYIHRNRSGVMVAGTFVLTDVSEYYELLRQSRELEASWMSLALEQERNRIAQEVHDTTGHTLTMIQSLLRLMRAELSGQETRGMEPAINEYISQAQELVSGGIRELRCAINQMKQERSGMTVIQGIRQLAGGVREIEVEIEVQGEDGERYTRLSPVIYSCLREAITNCLKYAHATHMDVIIKFESAKLSLYIFDNGQGCAEIQDGNGLCGIRERARLAGGTVRFMSEAGQGFQIYLELPVTAEPEH